MGCGAAGTPGRGDSLGAGERSPTSCSCLRGLVSPCPALPAAVTREPGSEPQRRLQLGALPTASEKAPHSALYNPRPGRAGGGIGPPSARPSPPPGAPRPRPSPPPARRPLAVRRTAAGQPLSHGRGRSLQPSLHLPSRFTPPAVGCPGLRLPDRTVGSAPAIFLWPSAPRLSPSRYFR